MIFTMLIWLASDIFFSLSFIYFMEFSSNNLREKSNASLLYSYTFGIIFGHLVAMWSMDFKVLYGIIFGYSLLTLYVYYQMTDTPFFYYSQKQFGKFKAVMTRMYQMNQLEIETTSGK
jgi:hypothetical protein